MDFPISDLMDENVCCHYLLDLLRPEGLHRPRCRGREGFQVHRYFREPVLDHLYRAWERVFNADYRGEKVTLNPSSRGVTSESIQMR